MNTRTAGLTTIEILLSLVLTTTVVGGLSAALGSAVQASRQGHSQVAARAEGLRLMQSVRALGPIMSAEPVPGGTQLTVLTGEVTPCDPLSTWPTRTVLLDRLGRLDGDVVGHGVTAAAARSDGAALSLAALVETGETVSDSIPLEIPVCPAEDLVVWDRRPARQEPVLGDPVRAGVGGGGDEERERREMFYADRNGNPISADDWGRLDPQDRYVINDPYAQNPEPQRPTPGLILIDCRPGRSSCI